MPRKLGAGLPLSSGEMARKRRMAPAAMMRAASASTHTPTVRLAAPTHAPCRSVSTGSANAVPAMAQRRKTVPSATWRVWPALIMTPWMKRR